MSQVHVCVPCYRYGQYLRDCVQSVLNQDGVEVRVLIIDDASPDNTPEVAAQLKAEDSRVEYIRHAQNRGHIATYNEGLEWVSGDYTVLLSADDMLTPGALARAAALLDAHPEVGLVYGRAVKFSDSRMLPPARQPENGRRVITPGLEWLRARCEDGFCSPNHRLISPEAVMRTRLGKRLGGFRPELPVTADVETWLRFAAHGDIGFLPDADQAYYRVHGANMHIRVKQDPLLEVRQRREAFETLFREHGARIPDLAELRQLANRKFADDAIATGCELFDRGLIEAEALPQFIQFARDVYYHNGRSRRYDGLHARRLFGRRLFPLARSLTRAVLSNGGGSERRA